MSAKSRGARFFGRTVRIARVIDRKGTRWMLQALSPAPVIVLVHRGRQSVRVFKTPIRGYNDAEPVDLAGVLAEVGGELRILPTVDGASLRGGTQNPPAGGVHERRPALASAA
jgi:hypothetical protein